MPTIATAKAFDIGVDVDTQTGQWSYLGRGSLVGRCTGPGFSAPVMPKKRIDGSCEIPQGTFEGSMTYEQWNQLAAEIRAGKYPPGFPPDKEPPKTK